MTNDEILRKIDLILGPQAHFSTDLRQLIEQIEKRTAEIGKRTDVVENHTSPVVRRRAENDEYATETERFLALIEDLLRRLDGPR